MLPADAPPAARKPPAAAPSKSKGRAGAKTAADQQAKDDFEKKHPRSAKGRVGGGEWMQKGAGMDQPDQRVQHLQNRLNSLGYQVGSDGRFGPETEAALKRFQADHGLAQDGAVGPATTASLRGARPGHTVAPAAGGQGGQAGPTPAPNAPDGTQYGDKYRGKAGADARAKQNFQLAKDANLTKTGTQNPAGQTVNAQGQPVTKGGSGSRSGGRSGGSSSRSSGGGGVTHAASSGQLATSYDPNDPASIRRFQQAHSLTVDGIAGPQTQAALGRRDARQNAAGGSPSGGGSSRASSGSRSSRGAKALHLGAGMGSTKGDKGVQEMQALLDSLGYDLGGGGTDGRFGRDTAKALKTFQRRYGMNPDGILGPKTRRALLHVAKTDAAKEKAKPGSTLEEADHAARVRRILQEGGWTEEARHAALLARKAKHPSWNWGGGLNHSAMKKVEAKGFDPIHAYHVPDGQRVYHPGHDMEVIGRGRFGSLAKFESPKTGHVFTTHPGMPMGMPKPEQPFHAQEKEKLPGQHVKATEDARNAAKAAPPAHLEKGAYALHHGSLVKVKDPTPKKAGEAPAHRVGTISVDGSIGGMAVKPEDLKPVGDIKLKKAETKSGSETKRYHVHLDGEHVGDVAHTDSLHHVRGKVGNISIGMQRERFWHALKPGERATTGSGHATRHTALDRVISAHLKKPSAGGTSPNPYEGDQSKVGDKRAWDHGHLDAARGVTGRDIHPAYRKAYDEGYKHGQPSGSEPSQAQQTRLADWLYQAYGGGSPEADKALRGTAPLDDKSRAAVHKAIQKAHGWDQSLPKWVRDLYDRLGGDPAKLEEAEVSDTARQDHDARVRRILEADSTGDRPSKAAGSSAKCASCGRGIPAGLKAGRDKCPHCGKAINTDAKVIKEGELSEAAVAELADLPLAEAVAPLDSRDWDLVREGLAEAADSMAKASSPEPFSRSKTSNWVARGGGLPAYIQHIAHDLMEKRGKTESNAIQMAIGIVKRWAKGLGNVDANTRAAAAKAVAEWEALKAKAHAKP